MVFWLHHVNTVDLEIVKWQFLEQANLTPLSFSQAQKFNPLSGDLEKADITTDEVTGLPGVTVREGFWLGFGNQCSITDQIVRLLLNRIKGVADPIPTAVKRMPVEIKQKYYPMFLNLQNFTGFSHFLEEVGECNPRCLPIVKPTFIEMTENGRQHFLSVFEYDGGFDLGTGFIQAEQNFVELWRDLNRVRYCSPYVTTY